MKYLLKNIDKKIISTLDGQSRISINVLAKKLKMSKDGVNYRLKKLINDDIIRGFSSEIDISKLGYIIGKVTIQFQNNDDKKSEQIFEYLKKQPQIPWVAYCIGRWDCIFGFFVKEIYDVQDMLTNLSEKFGEFILAKEVLMEPKYYIVSRSYENKLEKRIIAKVGGKINDECDLLDKKILSYLSKDCRTPILEMSLSLKQSSGTIINRIKNLENKGVIQGYFIRVNLNKIGLEYCKAFVYLQNHTKEEYKNLTNFCLNHPNIIAVSDMIGSWEIEIELEVENFDAVYIIMNKIKTKFKNIIKRYEAVTITKEYGRDYQKFL